MLNLDSGKRRLSMMQLLEVFIELEMNPFELGVSSSCCVSMTVVFADRIATHQEILLF